MLLLGLFVLSLEDYGTGSENMGEIISSLENISEILFNSGYNSYGNTLRKTIVLLKEQEPRVLTTDELFHMEHQGVYIERRNSQLYATEPAIVLRTSVCEPSLGGNKYILMRENKLSDSRLACDYNKDRRNGWRCWTSKPTEEQRKAVKWA